MNTRVLEDYSVLPNKIKYLEERIVKQTQENQDIYNSIANMELDFIKFEKSILSKEDKIKDEFKRIFLEKEKNEIEIANMQIKAPTINNLSVRKSLSGNVISNSIVSVQNKTNNTAIVINNFFDNVNTIEGKLLIEMYKIIISIVEPKVNIRNMQRNQINEETFIKGLMESSKKLEIKILTMITELTWYERIDKKLFDEVSNKRKELNKQKNFLEGLNLIKMSKIKTIKIF